MPLLQIQGYIQLNFAHKNVVTRTWVGRWFLSFMGYPPFHDFHQGLTVEFLA